MPEVDGFEATKLIRKAERLSGEHVPIIAMTANAMEGDRDLCIAAGMDDYLSKPVDMAKLRELIECWLPGAAASGVASAKKLRSCAQQPQPVANARKAELGTGLTATEE